MLGIVLAQETASVQDPDRKRAATTKSEELMEDEKESLRRLSKQWLSTTCVRVHCALLLRARPVARRSRSTSGLSRTREGQSSPARYVEA